MKLYRGHALIRPDLQAHIYSRALLNNAMNLKRLCAPGTRFCAVVKANAYGHGLHEVVNVLQGADVDFFAVASFYEAIHIAEMVHRQSILILEPLIEGAPPDQVFACAHYDLHCVAASLEAVTYVAGLLAGGIQVLNLHLNVESGMGRCGVEEACAAEMIRRIDACPNLRLAGIYTHFATADEDDHSYARDQLKRFNGFLDRMHLRARPDVLVHAANSAATIKMPDAHFDMVRCGVSLYGYYSRPMANAPVRLEPAMKLQAPITQLKRIAAGESVSYGRSFMAPRDTTAAIIPLGYADGYRRCFSNRAVMKLGEHIAPVIGRVCMDQIILDVTDVPGVRLGQIVTVIDSDHDSPCGVYRLAELADTICYEILTCVHAHVNRIVH
ncbi:MAG: alanine racemase [Phycisphaerae bacterium]|nr:alanine racemase [Phycisphaerae bacterium]